VAVDQSGCILLTAPTNAGDSLRIREQTMSGNFDLKAKMSLSPTAFGGTACIAGLAMTNNAGGKVMICGLYTAAAAQYLVVQKYNSVTSWNSNPVLAAAQYSILLDWAYFRVRYDGTNLYFYMSGNGIAWTLMFTEAAATFLGTPDRAGIFVNNNALGADVVGVFDSFRDV
jgi:hypothetical protein